MAPQLTVDGTPLPRVRLVAFALSLLFSLAACPGPEAPHDASQGTDAAEPPHVDCAAGSADRGESSVSTRGCRSCHNADLGGAVAGAPGRNLTPANLSGWSDAEIAHAILDGVTNDGEVLCEVMTRFRGAGMNDAEACDIVAYLRSIPPVERTVVDTCR